MREIIDGGVFVNSVLDEVGAIGETAARIGFRHATMGGNGGGLDEEQEQEHREE